MRYKLLCLFIIMASVCTAQRKDTLRLNPGQRERLKNKSLLTNFKMNDVYQEVNELSYIAPLGEIGPKYKYIFSADINPLFFVSGGIRSRWNLAFGARVKIRMFNDSSFSVRTPSYMPNIRVFYRLNNSLPRYRYVEFDVYHHSNGQDGSSKVNGQWNTYNGNFSTNFVKLGFNWGVYDTSNMTHWGIYLQQHFGIEGALEQDRNLKHVYGQTRINAEWLHKLITRVSYTNPATNSENFALYKEKWRFHTNLSYILLGVKDVSLFDFGRRLNAETTAYYSLKSWKKASLFLTAGYYGEDPYNIYFHKSYGFLRFGIATGGMFLKVDPKYTEPLQ